MSKRTKSDGLKTKNSPRQRRGYLDYDYVAKLSPDEKDFLAKFSDEYYGSDFEINETYIYEDGKYVQISGNSDPSQNRDLRKYRNVRKYYKNSEGEFRWAEKFKYTENNIHSEKKQRQACNRNANANARDLMSVGHPAEVAKEEFQYFLENLQEGMSPEDMMILREKVEQKMQEEE